MINFLKKIISGQKRRTLALGFISLILLSVIFVPIFVGAQQSSVNCQKASLLDIKSGLLCALDGFLTSIAWIFLAITSAILYAGGTIFNASLQLAISDFRNYANSAGVNTVWSTFRDMANMIFIFILLYVAIGTILGLSNINMKKMLTRIVIVALLLNFSLFFTKVVIDASNILAVAFYNSIVKTDCNGHPAGGVSNAVMCKIGITDLYSLQAFNNIGSKTPVGIMTFAATGSLFMIIASFVMIAAALMFVVRSITLIILLILSPLAFASMALPNDRYSHSWTEKLIKQCLFAPAFLAMLWATMQILSVVPTSPPLSQIFAAKESGEIDTALIAGQTLLNFVLVLGFIVGSLLTAEQFGGYGASGAVKMLRSGASKTQGWIARNTAGRFGASADQFIANRVPGGDSRSGRFVRGMTTGALAGSKFGGTMSRTQDADRIEKERTDIANKAEERRNLSIIRAGASRNATQAQKEEAQRILSRMSNKGIDNLGYEYISSYVPNLNPSQLEHVLEKSDKFNEQEREKIKQERFKQIESSITTINSSSATAAQKTQANDDIKAKLKELSDKEIELIDSSVLSHLSVATNLKASQIESINKSNKFTAAQKKTIKTNRMKPFIDALAVERGAITGSPAHVEALKIIASSVEKMTPKEIAGLEDADLTHPAVMAKLGASKLKELPDEKSDAVRSTIGAAIKGDRSHPAYKYVTKGVGSAFFG